MSINGKLSYGGISQDSKLIFYDQLFCILKLILSIDFYLNASLYLRVTRDESDSSNPCDSAEDSPDENEGISQSRNNI